MLNRGQIEKLFNADGHLSEEGIAFWVDALQYQKTEILPEKVREHVENCAICRSSVIEAYSILEQKGQHLPKHPYFDNADNQTKQPGKHKINLWFKIAASVLILVSIAAVLLFQLRQNKNSDKLFAEYFSPYPNIILERNRVQEHQNKSFITAMDYYDKGEFMRASQYFKKLEKSGVLSDTTLFYYGNVCLAMGNRDKAVELFKQLLSDNSSRFILQAEWYLALAYLSENQLDQCRLYLKKIVRKETHFKTKAQELFNKIE